MRIETPRLIIRSFAVEDIPPYAELVADPDVMRYINDGRTHRYDEAQRYVLAAIAGDRGAGVARYAVLRKPTDEFIGFCGFREIDGHIDFGWRYLKVAWGNGYATEAAQAILEYGIAHLTLKEIHAVSLEANAPSVKIIRKLGFTEIGRELICGREAIRYSVRVTPNNRLQPRNLPCAI